MTDTEILATVIPSAPRRMAGLGMLAGLGGLLVYVALATSPMTLQWRFMLLVMGAVVLWLADKMRRATLGGVELTRTELRTTSGRVLARIADIEAVERGVFALKPSNGFTVRTRMRQSRAWAPGVWWRVGRRVGVGGVTAAAQARAMSEILAAVLAENRE